LKDGSFVVIWQDSGGVAFRRYIGNGVPLDSNPLFVPNSSGGFLPKLTALNDGGFAVAWTTIVGTELDGSPELEVVLQRFSASGTAIGSRVDLDEPGDQGLFGMSIATLEDGRIIITYGSETGDSTNITTLNYRILDPRDATILGSNGDDNIVGRTDGSFVSGLDGKDKLTGGDVQDTLNGGNGNDTLFGLGGNDNLVALDGNDSLDGGTGNDTVVGGNGNDTINGGLGLDTAVYGSEGNTVNLSLTGPQVTGSPAGSGTDRLSSVENLQTGSGNDRLTGNSSNNRLDGGTDNDTLNGAEGDDTLIGGAGNDLLTGSSGRDTLTSGSTSDVDRFSFAILTQRQDTMTDFDRVNSPGIVGSDQDIIQVSNSGFNPTGGASDLSNGVLPTNRLVNGAVSLDNRVGFRYFQATGQLYFDSNGGNHDPGAGSLLLATLANRPTFASMSNSIVVI
jgi:Ca2+-binding RTX toxin-like protein